MQTRDEMTTDERRKYMKLISDSADKWLSESITCYLW